MPGLDKKILDSIDHNRAIKRVELDIRTDFILAPHYNAIFVNAGDELWAKIYELLRSGNYCPELPLTISVPKERGFTRPGSILQPIDRLIYQALIDLVVPNLENQLDRGRAFSNEPSADENLMFEPAHQSWEKLQKKIMELCSSIGFIVKADVANYFERIPQHHLINLINAAGCTPEVVNLLEEILLAFRGRDSFGIIQGVFPSDILGNFFLSDFDAFCELNDIPSARYVDDFYLRFESAIDAQKGLINLIERLRLNGLHLNEFKSGIKHSEDVIREETEIDKLFTEAKDEVESEFMDFIYGYGFNAAWELDEYYEEPDEDYIQLEAVNRLYNSIDEYPDQADKIEKFCLPLLRASKSDIAISPVLQNLTEKPYLTRLYQAYLSKFTPENKELASELQKYFKNPNLVTDFQRMYLLGALMNASTIDRSTVNTVLHWLKSSGFSQELRGISAIFAAKHGTPQQKRTVRLEYESESSLYVRASILYASRYFTSAEKRTCIKAWGGHNIINALISQSMKK